MPCERVFVEMLTGPGGYGFHFHIIMSEQTGVLLYCAGRSRSPEVDLFRTLDLIHGSVQMTGSSTPTLTNHVLMDLTWYTGRH